VDVAVVVPLKDFSRAKLRLRSDEQLDATALAEQLARGVVVASRPRTVVVVTEDPGIVDFATKENVEVLLSSATDLNGAVQFAYATLTERFDALYVVHGDLRFPEGLGTFEPPAPVTLYADHRHDGTNVLVLPTGLDFHFAYGPGSLRRHVLEAERLGLNYEVVRESSWAFDVDEPGDLKSP